MSANSSAFPETYNPGPWELSKGLTKREYFAGQVINGLCSNLENFVTNPEQAKGFAKCAFFIADEMIKASQVQP